MRSAACCLLVLLACPAPTAAQRVLLGARNADTTIVLDFPAVPAAFPAGPAPLWRTLDWRRARPGLWWTELELAAGTLRIPVRAILVRIDPRLYDFRLELATRANGMTGTWLVDSAGVAPALALNAGQFKETGPWGWLVLNRAERRDPGFGPLSVGIAFDDAGRVRWIPPARLAAARHDPQVVYAFQSYPLLLWDGRVPARARDRRLVDQRHRDARLIFGELPDTTLLIVLTRFDVLGAAAARVPIGLTLPESIVLVGALGARHAVMLDGGVSAQLLVRPADAGALTWKGLRPVPLALLATPRQ